MELQENYAPLIVGNFQALSYFGVAKYIGTFYITIYELKKNNKSFAICGHVLVTFTLFAGHFD